jgi:hydrogenase maturation protease
VCIGVGNLYRRDDGVGLYVAQRLRLENVPGVCVIEHSGEGTSLMEALADVESVILVDAVCSGAAPGTIHAFDPNAERLPVNTFSGSSHAFGVAEAVELARSLGRLPGCCRIYGIEAACVSMGIGLTPVVERGARRLVPMITHTLWVQHAAALTDAMR